MIFLLIFLQLQYSYLVTACNCTLLVVLFPLPLLIIFNAVGISWGKLPEDADSKICIEMRDYREKSSCDSHCDIDSLFYYGHKIKEIW